jgi:hypothetical protein
MRLSQLLSLILAKTPLTVSVPENDDRQFENPETLFGSAVHPTIVRTVAHACRIAGFSERGAYAFGEFIAQLVTGWTTQISDKADILALDAAFTETAYGSSNKVIRIYLLPNWDALREHLPAIQHGVAAAFALAKTLHIRKTEAQQEAEKSPSSRAIASIVLGILGLLSGCGLIVFSPLAWYLGRKELKAIQAGLSPKSGEGYARVGVVLGIIGTIICVLLLLLYLVVIIYWFKATPVSP